MAMKTTWRIGLATLGISFLYACASKPQQHTDAFEAVPTPAAAFAASGPASLENASALPNEEGLLKTEVIIDKASPLMPDVYGVLARLTAAQQARIEQAVSLGSDAVAARSLVLQATPKMQSFIERLACIKSYNDGGAAALQALAAPGASFKFFVPPMHSTKLHDKSKCLSVQSVIIKHVKNPLKPGTSSWTDALQIKVSLIADDTGEKSTSNHEINKNMRGVWWFTR